MGSSPKTAGVTRAAANIKMMGWRVIFSSLLLCGGALCRPNFLEAAQGFPFQQNILNQRHHGHSGQFHHRQGHSLEVSPLDGLYGAPAELPSYGAEELPVYNIPAAASAPSPSVAAPVMMMMDPSYSFEYKSEDSERTEDADSTGSITGKYGYKTAGGNDILVKYSAGADTGFVIENMDDLAAALERSANEAALVKAKPYTGETVEVNYVWPNVDAASMTQDSSYSYGYKGSDKAQNEESDASGNVKGSYSFKTADGQDFEVKYTSGLGGFVVENLEELLAKSNPQSAEYALAVAEQAALASSGQSVVALRAESTNSPAAETYIHQEIEAEPYSHKEIEAESYNHQEIEAEPYFHEEFEAEPYIHEEIEAEAYKDEQVVYVHNEIDAEPYIHVAGTSASANTYSAAPLPLPGYETHNNNPSKHNGPQPSGRVLMDQSFNSEGDNILVQYSAGKDGFVILNPRDVLPQAPVV